MTRALTTLVLAALYLGVLGSVALADVVVALFVGAFFALALPSSLELRGARTALWQMALLPLFLIGVVREVLRGAAGMTFVVLGVRDWRHQGVLEVELDARTAIGITVSALVTGLSPGSVVVDIDYERRVMVVHVIDASEPARVQGNLRHFYERFQRFVFP